MDELEQIASAIRQYLKTNGSLESYTIMMSKPAIKGIYEAIIFYLGYMHGALAREEERQKLMMNMNYNNPDDGPNPPPPKGKECPPNNVCENH